MPRRRSPVWLWAVAALAVVAGLSSVWLAVQAERKLAGLALGGLGESFSTRLWSAPFVLRTGMKADPARVQERLERLGYKRVEGFPGRGEYRAVPGETSVFLRGFRSPTAAQDEGTFLLREDDLEWTVLDAAGGARAEALFEPELVAELTDSHGVRREPATWEQIPQSLKDAVISAEDKRFLTHWGLDPRAMARALWANVRGRDLQGASTITQQLAKNLFLSPRRTLARKVAEAGLSVYLELRLDKTRILTLYLNHIYLGQDGPSSVMGVRAAARHYFSKEVRDLTLPESALIAGIVRGPGLYNPFRDPVAARARRDRVLRRMREDGAISEEELERALAEPVEPVRGNTEEDRRDHAYFTAEVVRQLLPRYEGESLYRQGLAIHTTMDPVLQGAAQKVLRAARQQAALVALDPRDGSVVALAGGRDFGKSQFNRATQALRQPGSAFKPFIYAAAMRMGLTPATILHDKPKSYPGDGREWSPANYDGVYHGTATAREALTRSLNAATLDLAERVGLKRIEETARACGITSPMRSDLGLALGASEVGLLELTAAYAPFVNGGLRPTPRLVTAVVDAEGRVLEAAPPESVVALDPNAAYLTQSALRSVVQEGTARSLAARGFTVPAAGKTGTTNDGRDAWFVGFTSSLLAGVWTGDDGNKALKLTGAKDALPLWAEFVKESLPDRAAEPFARPDGVVEARICVESGMLARSGCPRKRDEEFVAGSAPLRDCELHRGGLMGWLERMLGKGD